MVRLKKILEHPIIATVIGGLILSFLLWLSGYFEASVKMIGSAITHIWETLFVSISIPIWVLIVFLIVVYLGLALKKMYQKKAKEESEEINANDSEEIGEFSTIEKAVIEVLSRDLQARHTLADMATKIDFSELSIQHALDCLVASGYVHVSRNAIYGNGYKLNEHGRRLAIEVGLG